jgi:cytochrome c oxidase subunit 2
VSASTPRARAIRAGRLVALVGAVVLGGCSLNHVQSALEPAGRQAAHIEGLWWFAFWTAAAVYLLTIGALVWATLHGTNRPEPSAAGIVEPPPEGERRLLRGVVGATGATLVVLLAFLVVDLFTSRSLVALQREPAMIVKVTGIQWWWRVEYVDTNPSRTVLTANELHIPVGRPVQVELNSQDVIHSFWVPALQGKRDLVPGLKNRLWLRADRAGIYRGECAEFCGHQHAKMAFMVIAEPQADFDRWYAAQQRPAAPPTDSLRAQGLATFEGRACAVCHQIRGTRAAGHVAPDLTHLASRLTIAAGALPNRRGHLGGWITDPQSIKPGTRMPPNSLPPGELHALLAYLEGLK